MENGDHLSGSVIANALAQSTRMSNGTSSSFILLDLAPGGVCLSNDITAAAGGLLHRRFTLAVRLLRSRQQYTSLLHYPSGRPARPLAGAMLYGVRTFLNPERAGSRSPSQLGKGIVMQVCRFASLQVTNCLRAFLLANLPFVYFLTGKLALSALPPLQRDNWRRRGNRRDGRWQPGRPGRRILWLLRSGRWLDGIRRL